MANEHTYSDAADLRTTNILNREIWELLADMTDLRSVCRWVQHPLSGSSIVKTPQIDPEYAWNATGENTTVANSAIVDSSFSLTIARRTLRFEETALTALTNPEGGIDVDGLAAMIARSYGQDFSAQLTALFGSLSNSVGGGAGVDLTVDDIFDGQFQLHTTNTPGPFICVLAPHSHNELVTSLRGETGALQFVPATAEMLRAKGPGYKGSWNGIEFYTHDSVVDAGTTRDNAMFGYGCFAYTEADTSKLMRFIDRRIAPVAGSPLLVTTVWDDDSAKFRIIGNVWNAVAEAEDARGVLLSTDD